MATVPDTTPAPAMQPGLRPFIIYDRVPEGCAAYLVPDARHEPLLRPGEWVIVDLTDREPAEDELFVIQWQSGPSGPQVVECGLMPKLTAQWAQPVWAVGARHRGVNTRALGFGAPGNIVGDFPYKSPQLTERFLGRVIGILEPSFVEPVRALVGGLN